MSFNNIYKKLKRIKGTKCYIFVFTVRAATIRFDASEIDYRPADAIFDS